MCFYSFFFQAEDGIRDADVTGVQTCALLIYLAETKKRQEHNRQRRLGSKLQTRLQTAYKQADNRLLLLDYDGTLVPLVKRPELARPDSQLLQNLTGLACDPKNTVVVISGRDRKYLSQRSEE